MLVILQDFPCNSEYLKLVKESIAFFYVSTQLVNDITSINFLSFEHTVNTKGF